jgi:hypothetical protein
MENSTLLKDNRRSFLRKTFSSCAFCCFAAPMAFASGDNSNLITTHQKHKFQSDSGMTMQQVYNFAYKQWYIPAMKNLMLQIGKEKFLNMLKTSSEMLYTTRKEADFSYNERTLTAFAENLKKGAEGFYKLRCTFEFIYADEHVLEMRTTECLWAKTFREADAADIGYAGFCYQDYPWAKAYNPKLKFIREKNLLQGLEYCDNKCIIET